jgi:hypothetical protein
MLILDKKMKQAIKKYGIWGSSCVYIYPDGIVFSYNQTHTYKGKEFTDKVVIKQKADIKIYNMKTQGREFVGRIVCQKPSILLDGISNTIQCYYEGSIAMREKGINYQSISFTTNMGIEITEIELPGLMAGYITIQDGQRWDGKTWNMDEDFPQE